MRQNIKTIEYFNNIIHDKNNWVFYQGLNGLDWIRLCSEARPTVEFIAKFERMIIWRALSTNKLLSKPVIDKYSDRLDWHLISRNHVLNSYFVTIYLDKLNLTVVYDRACKLTLINLKDDTLCKLNDKTLKILKFTLEMDSCARRI